MGGCSDRGTATGPAGAAEAGAAEAGAVPEAPPDRETAPPSSAPGAPGRAADDDDSAGPGPAGDDDSAGVPAQTTVSAQTPAQGGAGGKELICDDREDNDGDRAVDCDDTDCWAVPACEAPEPGGWAERAPGPGLGVDGEKAPGPEGVDGGPRRPEDDGVGVACADYIGCVCGLSEAEAGRTIGGYSHTVACQESGTLVGNPAEEFCGEELDKLKGVLGEAAEDYAEAEVTLPASCN